MFLITITLIRVWETFATYLNVLLDFCWCSLCCDWWGLWVEDGVFEDSFLFLGTTILRVVERLGDSVLISVLRTFFNQVMMVVSRFGFNVRLALTSWFLQTTETFFWRFFMWVLLKLRLHIYLPFCLDFKCAVKYITTLVIKNWWLNYRSWQLGPCLSSHFFIFI